MRLILTHGYMLRGSGSNIYVQNLCRALVRNGHEVHLLCQEPHPLDYDFVNAHLQASAKGVELLGSQDTPYKGYCALYRPRIRDLLPVYVYDDYPGWRVKTFLELEQEEFEYYATSNAAAIRAVLSATGAKAVVTNHALPGPLVARRALENTGVPYLSIVHGSALQYVARRSRRYLQVAREGLAGAGKILALSSHSAGTVIEDFPALENKVFALPGGVDTSLFRPDALDAGALKKLSGGPGRGPHQADGLRKLLERSPESAAGLAEELDAIASSYNARAHDTDAGERLGAFLDGEAPRVICVGKLIHSKGIHSLISAFAHVRRQTGAHLLVIGFGTFREALEALVYALSAGDRPTVELLARSGKLFEGGSPSPLEHFTLSEDFLRDADGLDESVEFVGPLYHAELARLLPAADTAVVPSIFPESFGLVAAEMAASGVPPFVADHSGLREVGGIVGQGLPFDLRVGMEGFEENLARALVRYLQLSEKEQLTYGKAVHNNSVAHLSWDTLARQLAELAES